MNIKTRLGAATLAGCLLAAICCDTLTLSAAQDVRFNVAIPRAAIVQRAGPQLIAQNQQDPSTEEGAALKTDPDLESVLGKADRYRQDGNYSLASQLWQIVLQKSGDTLYSQDGRTYFSMVDQVESILAGLPAEGLAIYRITADAAAKQIIARAAHAGDPQALSEVVRLYFISSVGDEAAFQLACVYLDQYDFVGALRLLRKIQQHPDPSIAAEEITARLALCQIMAGDLSGAEQSLATLGEEVNQTNSRGWQLEQLLTQVRQGNPTSLGSLGLGGFRQFRVQPLPDQPNGTDNLTSDWQTYVEPVNNSRNHAEALRTLATSSDSLVRTAADTVTSNERTIIDSWLAAGWQPSGFPVFVNDLVIWKSPYGLSAWPAKLSDSAPRWRSAWLNQFEPDDATKAMQTVQRMYDPNQRGGSSSGLNHDHLVQLYGDRIHSQLDVINGVVYTLEGRRYDPAMGGNNRAPNAQRGFQFNNTFRRARANFLVAYEAVSGRALWSLPLDKEQPTNANANTDATMESPYLVAGGFMSAPIAFGSVLIAPVNQSGAIYLYALDPNDRGRTLWKTYLCDEPETGANAWSPIQLTIEGSDLFVASGMGVVFVVDPATGMVRFAQRYDRVGKRNTALRQFNWQVNRMDFNGWSEDIIIPYGRQMICFASDSNRVFALDRNSGRLIWETDMNPLGFKVDYLLGILGDTLYAAGSQTVIAFDLAGEGRMLWGGENMFESGRSYGRGILTDHAIYLPVDDAIWKYSLDGKKGQPEKLSAAHVDLQTGAPIGNLASDGIHLWVHQGSRLIRLRSIEKANESSTKESE